MNRDQSVTTLPWPWRWLLILLAVAGLGLGTGNHCTEHTVAVTRAPAQYLAVAITATNPRTAVGTDVNTRPESNHDQARPESDDHGSVDTADECRPASPTAANIVATATGVHLPVIVRTMRRVASCPRPARSRLLPAIILTHIGVSRT